MIERGPTWQEPFRHQCECRDVIRMAQTKGWGHVETYLSMVEKRRGVDAVKQLKADIKRMWKAGNRGEYGDLRGIDVPEPEPVESSAQPALF